MSNSSSHKKAAYPAFGSPFPYAEPLWYSRNVSPHYNDSHRKLRAAVRKYVDEEILPNAFEWESAGEIPESVRVTPIQWAFWHLANAMQAWQRHVEMGYVGMVTGLPNIKTPGDIPMDQWDSWHSLIMNDELSRVVRTPRLFISDSLTSEGIHGSSVGPWRR